MNPVPTKLSKGWRRLRDKINEVIAYLDRTRVIPINGFQETDKGVLPPPQVIVPRMPLEPFIVSKPGSYTMIAIEPGIIIGRAGDDPHSRIVPTVAGDPIDSATPHELAIEVSEGSKLFAVFTYSEDESRELTGVDFQTGTELPDPTETEKAVLWAEVGPNNSIVPSTKWRGNFFAAEYSADGEGGSGDAGGTGELTVTPFEESPFQVLEWEDGKVKTDGTQNIDLPHVKDATDLEEDAGQVFVTGGPIEFIVRGNGVNGRLLLGANSDPPVELIAWQDGLIISAGDYTVTTYPPE